VVSASVAWGGVLFGLLVFWGGLAGLRSGLHGLAGDSLHRVVRKWGRRPWLAVVTGILVTALVQSSSAVSVIVVSLTEAGIVPLPAAALLVLGANLGTTVTGQIAAWRPLLFSPLLFLLAMVSMLGGKRGRLCAYCCGGLGLVFVGLELMVVFASATPAAGLLHGGANFYSGLAAGTVVTGILQSSSAVTGLAMGLAAGGVIPMLGAAGMVLGSNIGTCVTALLAASGRGREARRLAIFHLMFNILGVALAIPWVRQLLWLCGWYILGPERCLANLQTFFNLATVVMGIAFLKPLLTLVRWLVPR
jgi:phosphate:Na+ symporter